MWMELVPALGTTMSISDIDRRISELEQEFQELFATSREEGGYLKHADIFKQISDDMISLKENEPPCWNNKTQTQQSTGESGAHWTF